MPNNKIEIIMRISPLVIEATGLTYRTGNAVLHLCGRVNECADIVPEIN